MTLIEWMIMKLNKNFSQNQTKILSMPKEMHTVSVRAEKEDDGSTF